MKPTIYDVAKKAGVSITTVSRVLNKFQGISPAKREAVLNAIQELGYVPNEQARSLANNKTNLIALYLPSSPLSFFESKYFLEFYRGVDTRLANTEYGLVILNDSLLSEPAFSDEPKYYQLVQKGRVDGLLFSGIPEDKFFPRLLEQKFPLVYTGKQIQKNTMNVYARFTEYMEEIFTAAMNKGHRKIFAYTYPFQIARMQAVAHKFAQNNNLPQNFIQVKDVNENWAAYLENEIKNKELSLLIIEPLQAVSLFLGYLFQNEITVPEDVSILSIEYEQEDGAQYLPAIGCVHVPAFEMGQSACDMLLNRINGGKENQTIEFESTLTLRGSICEK